MELPLTICMRSWFHGGGGSDGCQGNKTNEQKREQYCMHKIYSSKHASAGANARINAFCFWCDFCSLFLFHLIFDHSFQKSNVWNGCQNIDQCVHVHGFGMVFFSDTTDKWHGWTIFPIQTEHNTTQRQHFIYWHIDRLSACLSVYVAIFYCIMFVYDDDDDDNNVALHSKGCVTTSRSRIIHSYVIRD